MNQTYTRKQAMARLGLRSTNAFLQMAIQYPEAFVVMNREAFKYARYDKAALDEFAKKCEAIFRQLENA